MIHINKYYVLLFFLFLFFMNEKIYAEVASKPSFEYVVLDSLPNHYTTLEVNKWNFPYRRMTIGDGFMAINLVTSCHDNSGCFYASDIAMHTGIVFPEEKTMDRVLVENAKYDKDGYMYKYAILDQLQDFIHDDYYGNKFGLELENVYNMLNKVEFLYEETKKRIEHRMQ